MALALGLSLPAMASEKVIDMYKSENCGCCSLWGKAMEKDGFEVRTHVMNDQALSALKEKHAIPAGLRSCHTAVAGNLIIEGHVPATTIHKAMQSGSGIYGLATYLFWSPVCLPHSFLLRRAPSLQIPTPGTTCLPCRCQQMRISLR